MRRDIFTTETREVLGGEVTFAKYKGVVISFQEFPETIELLFVSSCNEGKGEVQEALGILMTTYKGKKVIGSLPTPVMAHIYDKLGVVYEKEG